MRADVRSILLVPRAHNLLVQSENLGTTWGNSNSSEELDVAVAPDGTISADRILASSAGGTGTVQINQAIAPQPGQVYTYSHHLHADALNWGRLVVAALGSLSINAFFDLANGVVGATIGGSTLAAGMLDVGGGWYRCWIAFRSDVSDVAGTVQARPADADNDDMVALDGASSILAWGAQLNLGPKPARYVRTTTAPVL